MTLFYSESVGGFLDSSLFFEIPEDAVEISTDEHCSLLEGVSSGKTIVVRKGKVQLAERKISKAETERVQSIQRDIERLDIDQRSIPLIRNILLGIEVEESTVKLKDLSSKYPE